jgi:hypothetical protein
LSDEPNRRETGPSPSPSPSPSRSPSSEEPRRPDVSRPPGRPPGPEDIRIGPFAGGFGVFTAVAIPIVVYGYTRAAGPDDAIIGIGVVVGLLVGVIAGLWLARRDGRVWRGPQL